MGWPVFTCQFRRAWAILGLTLLLTGTPSQADKLRIGPDDLRNRVAVSELLAPSLRLQLRDLAGRVPLPREGGLIQTEELLQAKFVENDWDANRQALVRYYFLVTRMEKSQDFSDEFSRRKNVTRDGRDLMREYIAELNSAIARGVFVPNVPIEVTEVQSFPLNTVGWREQDNKKVLQVLHNYPPAETKLGRETLRDIRDVAVVDLQRLEQQLDDIDTAEKEFLEEISLVGYELIELRPLIGKLISRPRAGLPFSF